MSINAVIGYGTPSVPTERTGDDHKVFLEYTKRFEKSKDKRKPLLELINFCFERADFLFAEGFSKLYLDKFKVSELDVFKQDVLEDKVIPQELIDYNEVCRILNFSKIYLSQMNEVSRLLENQQYHLARSALSNVLTRFPDNAHVNNLCKWAEEGANGQFNYFF